MEKVRIGIIGTGSIAQGHIQRLSAHPDAQITALCDIRQGALDNTVKQHAGLENLPQYHDYRDMLSSGHVDSVVICTPHTTHFEQIMTSLDRGMNVLCEKPIVCTIDHAHQVLKKIAESGKTFVLNYQCHYQPEFLYIKQQLEEGTYGRIQFVQGLQCQGWLKGCAGSWRHDPALSGGGQLNDSGSHLLAVLLFSTGLSVESVAGFIDNMTVPVDINSALSIKFVGGALGNLSVIGNYPSWHEDITITCENGAFLMRNGKLEVCPSDGKRFTPASEDMPKGNNPDDNFINVIMGREEVGSPAIWGLRVTELTQSAWQAAAGSGIATVQR